MRTRSAKKLAQRIDLYHFKHASPLRRWRTMLSIALPALGLLWLGSLAVAGSRRAYSSGPVSSAHAFAEAKCEVCHVQDTGFRAHVTEQACVTCHAAPPHAANQPTPPACSTCHLDHQGRVALSKTADDFCVRCHAGVTTTDGEPKIAKTVTQFPDGHPEFAASRADARDPGTLKFNHQIHLKADLSSPTGPEKLECTSCHKPEIARVSLLNHETQRKTSTGLMGALNYEQQCARCHPLFFDSRIDAQAPHDEPAVVRASVQQLLRDYAAQHPGDLSRPDVASRRMPLNFPRPQEPPARTPAEWVERRTARAEQLLWDRTCAYCHDLAGPGAAGDPRPSQLPVVARAGVRQQWMPKAKFDHAPHLMVECASCHAAGTSTKTSDSLMPPAASCATCHAPDKGAESRCFECHGYHDWTKEHAVAPRFKITDFK